MPNVEAGYAVLAWILDARSDAVRRIAGTGHVVKKHQEIRRWFVEDRGLRVFLQVHAETPDTECRDADDLARLLLVRAPFGDVPWDAWRVAEEEWAREVGPDWELRTDPDANVVWAKKLAATC